MHSPENEPRALQTGKIAAVGLWTLLAVVTAAAAAWAQAGQDEAVVDGPPQQTFVGEELNPSRSRLFPPRLCSGGLVYVPKFRHSSETGLGVGGEILHRFRWQGCEPGIRYSDVRIKTIWTLQGQFKGELVGNIHWGDGRYFIRTRLTHSSLPLRFWGLGPDTQSESEEVYRPLDTQAYIELYRQVATQFKVGLRYEYQQVKLKDVEPGGLLDTREYLGTRGEQVLGLGLVLDWDARDNEFAPAAGFYHQFQTVFFSDEIGSEAGFSVANIDLRKYFRLYRDHVLGVQVFWYRAAGDTPYWRLASLGGRHHSRGYRRARYIDNTMVAFQGEYRFPLFWRLNGAAFGGLADVGQNLQSLRLDQMRLSVGGGLRFDTGFCDEVRIRLDAALGQNSLRFYLGIGEAF